jgi:hypothetical protein
MAFDERFLAELRGAVRISDIVGRKFKLRRHGAEFEAVEDKSVKGNDIKGIWYDFGKGKGGGDAFEFLMHYEGLEFPQAVEEIARLCGRKMPGGNISAGHPASAQKNGADHSKDQRTAGQNGASRRGGKREITKTYDYHDVNGALLYQVVRFEWTDDNGKRQKSFGQRRPAPDAPPGVWVWGLDFVGQDGEPLEFMRRGPGRDWQRFDRGNYEAWQYTERRTFPDSGNVPHTLYRLPELRGELAEERQDQRTVLLCEGEKDAETLVAWGAAATTNSGGAKNFTEQLAQHFEGAADVVICEDHDEAGAQRTERIAPMLLAVGARVRVLRIAEHWPACPAKGDITDWRDAGGGTADQLFALVDRLRDWTPAPYRSKFGLRFWSQQGTDKDAGYRWLIKGLIPANHAVLIIGPSGSGKSFEAMEMAMHIARGADFAGRRTRQAGVIYCCYEMPKSMEKRVMAYRQFHNLPVDESIPFAWLTRPPGLFADEENAEALAQEILKGTSHWSVPIGVIVVDTNNAATRGSSEIKSEDIGKIMDRYALIAERTKAGIWIVGHTNAEGEHRGNQQLYNAIETCVVIRKETEGTGTKTFTRKDDLDRALRKAIVRKQREGEDDISWRFVLQEVEIGLDQDGDPITSMVSTEPQLAVAGEELHDRRADPNIPNAWHMNPTETTFFRALLKALSTHGIKPPPGLLLPASVALVVPWHDLTVAYRNVVPVDDPSHEGNRRYLAQIKSAMQRARESLQLRNIVGITQGTRPDGSAVHYLWPTGRPVIGPGMIWPSRMAGGAEKPKEAEADIGDLSDVF